jgi:hypothetical protein
MHPQRIYGEVDRRSHTEKPARGLAYLADRNGVRRLLKVRTQLCGKSILGLQWRWPTVEAPSRRRRGDPRLVILIRDSHPSPVDRPQVRIYVRMPGQPAAIHGDNPSLPGGPGPIKSSRPSEICRRRSYRSLLREIVDWSG